MAPRALQEALAVALERLVGALAAHRAAQPVGLAGGEAGERLGHFHHLVLEDDRAQRVLQHRLERRVRVGHLIGGVLAQTPATLDVGVDRPALDRAGSHDRHLHREVFEILRQGALQRLHLRTTLDLKDAHGVRGADRAESLGLVERDARQVDALGARVRDQIHAALHRREHSQPEQVDLQEAGVRAGVLVPLHHLATLHRRGHHRAAVDQRPG